MLVNIYIKVWFESPNSAIATHQDLNFIKYILNYSYNDSDISKIVLKKFWGQLWHLSEEDKVFIFW